MKNYIQKSYSVDILAPKNLSSGVPFLLGNFMCCVPVNDAQPGDLVTVYTEGIYEFPFSGTVQMGEAIYLDNKGNLTTDSNKGTYCGMCVASSNGGSVKIMINKSIDFKSAMIAACADGEVAKAIKAAVASAAK